MKRYVFSIALVLIGLATACSVFQAPIVAPAITPTLAPFVLPGTTEVPTPSLPTPEPPTVAAPLPTIAPALPTATLSVQRPPTAAPAPGVKRITFQPGSTSAILQGSLGPNGIDTYVLRASAGQTMSVNALSAQAKLLLSISGANGEVLKSMGAGSSTWSGPLPVTQDYILTLSTESGLSANYTLQVSIPPAASTVPESTPRRITFQPGAMSAVVQGKTATPGMDRFVLKASAGQVMTVNITSVPSNVILIIYGADGDVLISDHAGATTWSGTLPRTQDYNIDTRSVGSAVVDFTLTVTIPPVVAPPIARRISFPPGGITAVVQNGLATNAMDRWIVRAAGGQTMTASTAVSQGQVILIIFGADGNVLISDHAGATNWSGQLPLTQDYFIDVRAVGATPANYSLQVTIPPR